jgi:uncharacterized membrane protein YfcA
VTPGDVGILVAAGLGAGLVNGIAGGGSLVSFPVLIATGQTALVANVTSTVGIWPGYLGGVAGYREELAGQRARIRRLAPIAVAGAIAGAVLLLTTPAAAFRSAAPFLILFACGLFAVQPLLAKRLRGREVERDDAHLSPSLIAGVFLGSVYGAYFGAGLGVVLLAVLGATMVDRLVRLNGLRGVLSLLVNSVAVAVFAVAAPVAWEPAGLMAGASLVGGYVGARVARRVPAWLLRGAVLVFGVVAAARLLAG